MLYTELLRATVLLAGGLATLLAAVSAITIDRHDDATALIVALGWWTVAAATGVVIGRRPQTEPGSPLARLLAGARTQHALPDATPAVIMRKRLWPFLLFGMLIGGGGIFLPQLPVIGAGFALLSALAWRRREAAVAAIEDRDAVRFYVEPTSAVRPVSLIRTPFMGGERAAAFGKPPPPSEA